MALSELLHPGFQSLLAFLYILLGLTASWHALLTKRDPRAAMGWIGTCLLFPFGGTLLYFFFGINRIAASARRTRERVGLTENATIHPSDNGAIPAEGAGVLPRLTRIGTKVTGLPLQSGNEITMLRTGEDAYAAMLDAIDTAEHCVCLETYIFMADAVGERFIDALVRAARRGVTIRVIIDGVGEWYSKRRVSRMLRARGIQALRFLPPRLFPPARFINLRNHRKLLLIDDRLAFLGGMNISAHHLSNAAVKHCVVDRHFRVQGQVVAQLSDVFLEDWRFAGGERFAPMYQRADIVCANAWCRTIVDGPDRESGRIMSVLEAALSAAEQRVQIMTPYFLPPLDLLGELRSAALRGVHVTLLLPALNNIPVVHWAAQHILGELLAVGVDVRLQPPPFVHAKLFVVDGRYTVIGSANLDSRSLRLNFEMQLEVFDDDFARTLANECDRAAVSATPLTRATLEARSLLERTRDAICWLFSPYL